MIILYFTTYYIIKMYYSYRALFCLYIIIKYKNLIEDLKEIFSPSVQIIYR